MPKLEGFSGFAVETKDETMLFYNTNALDFLSYLYDNSFGYGSTEKYQQYVELASPVGYSIPSCRFLRTSPNAVIPTKSRASDVGYDLTIVRKVKDISPITAMYSTEIIIAPTYGYYTKVVPRSSLSKSGYILANSIGIIDGSYRGEVMIVLTKIDNTLPDLELPFKCAQLIIDYSIHYIMTEVSDEEELGETDRGEGGFGSTD
jgi:dUTP pyrophosphatase